MSKKQLPILYSKLLYEICRYFWDIQYLYTKFLWFLRLIAVMQAYQFCRILVVHSLFHLEHCHRKHDVVLNNLYISFYIQILFFLKQNKNYLYSGGAVREGTELLWARLPSPIPNTKHDDKCGRPEVWELTNPNGTQILWIFTQAQSLDPTNEVFLAFISLLL